MDEEQELTTERESEVREPVQQADTAEVTERSVPDSDVTEYVEPVDASPDTREQAAVMNTTPDTREPVAPVAAGVEEVSSVRELSVEEPVSEIPQIEIPEETERGAAAVDLPKPAAVDTPVNEVPDTLDASGIQREAASTATSNPGVRDQENTDELSNDRVASVTPEEQVESERNTEVPAPEPMAPVSVTRAEPPDTGKNTGLGAVPKELYNETTEVVSSRLAETEKEITKATDDRLREPERDVKEHIDEKLEGTETAEVASGNGEAEKEAPNKEPASDFSYDTKNEGDNALPGEPARPPRTLMGTPVGQAGVTAAPSTELNGDVTPPRREDGSAAAQADRGTAAPLTAAGAKMARDRIQPLESASRELLASSPSSQLAPESVAKEIWAAGEPGISVQQAAVEPTKDPSDGAMAVQNRRLTGTAELLIGGVPAGTLDLSLEER